MKQDTIELRCEAAGLRMTGQRRVIANVLQDALDHPDVEDLYKRATKIDPAISIATVYRTVKLFEEAGILEKLEFGDGRARYEDAERDHHDHLIDMQSGEVIEFIDSASEPPIAPDTVVTTISLTPSIVDGGEKVDTPFATPLLVTTYCSITIFSLVKALLTTPSPK